VAVEVDVLARERGDVLDLAAGDHLAAGAEFVEDALHVNGVPCDDRVDDNREAERLLALLIRGALADVAFVGVEDLATEGVELLAFVQLPADAVAELVVASSSGARLPLEPRVAGGRRLGRFSVPTIP
jgi:hypothetical protein